MLILGRSYYMIKCTKTILTNKLGMKDLSVQDIIQINKKLYYAPPRRILFIRINIEFNLIVFLFIQIFF